MKINELRVGNWYLSTKFQVPVMCGVDDFYEIYARADGSAEYTVDDIFEPLPLTEEWLLKFGFKEEQEETEILRVHWFKKLYNSENEVGEFCYNPSSLRTAIGYVDGEDYGYAGYKIRYVHQLQNLYFALTDEELIVK